MSSPGLWPSRLAAAWGQPAIVENHPGAGSTAAPALVAHAPPDGYTLLINTSAQAYSAARAGELPYDPLRDFVPVAALTSQPYVLVAGAQSGITTIGELAAAASGRPGEIRFASAGTGTGTHLAVAKLNRDLGIAAVHTARACCRTYRRSRKLASPASISRSGTGSGRQRKHRPASSARSPATSRTPSPRQKYRNG